MNSEFEEMLPVVKGELANNNPELTRLLGEMMQQPAETVQWLRTNSVVFDWGDFDRDWENSNGGFEHKC